MEKPWRMVQLVGPLPGSIVLVEDPFPFIDHRTRYYSVNRRNVPLNSHNVRTRARARATLMYTFLIISVLSFALAEQTDRPLRHIG